jgi:hypothetical protein
MFGDFSHDSSRTSFLRIGSFDVNGLEISRRAWRSHGSLKAEEPIGGKCVPQARVEGRSAIHGQNWKKGRMVRCLGEIAQEPLVFGPLFVVSLEPLSGKLKTVLNPDT